MKFAKLRYLFCVLCALVLFSCGKKDDKVPEPAPKHCIILKTDRLQNGWEFSRYYNYDGQRRLKSVTHGSNLHESNIAYNADGKISQIDNYYNGKVEDYETYEYDAKGQLSRRNDFFSKTFGDSPTLQEYYTYEYDNFRRVTKRNKFDAAKNEVISYDTYYYNGFTTCYKTTYIKDLTTGTFPYTRNETYTFDDKKGYLNYLGVVNDNTYKLTIYDEIISYSNITSIRGFSSLINEFTYEYNADGFPVKFTDHEAGSEPGVTTIMYDCE